MSSHDYVEHGTIIRLRYEFEETNGMWRLIEQEVDPAIEPVLRLASALPLVMLVASYLEHTVPIIEALARARQTGGSRRERLVHERRYEIVWRIENNLKTN